MRKLLFRIFFKKTWDMYCNDIIKLTAQIQNLKEQNISLINDNKKLKGQIK